MDMSDSDSERWGKFVHWGQRFHQSASYWNGVRTEKLTIAGHLIDARHALEVGSLE